MSNKGRVITLVCEITTDKYPEWIFDSHLKKNLGMGVRVKSIHEGDLSSVPMDGQIIKESDIDSWSDAMAKQTWDEYINEK